ncbi:MAG: hypothetical protein PT939_01130 [Aerococcus suis]|nr:hypothetical protein [Aerococcus suis]
MFFINSVILVILGLDILQIFTAISILPLSILYSLFLGIVAFYLAINMKDIYFFNNLFINILPLVSGIAIPISVYPNIFKYMTWLFPYGKFLEMIYNQKLIGFDLIIHLLVISLVGIVLYRYRVAFFKT